MGRPKEIKFLTTEETRRLFAVVKGRRDRALFLVAYRHGLRASEVGLLRRADVDHKRMRIMLHRLKGSHSGEHPLQPDELRALRAYLAQRADDSPILFPSRRLLPISRRMLDYLIKFYGARAKLPDDKRHFHVLKHSIATHLWEKSGDIRFVQDWLGHANIQNTLIYTTLTSEVRDAKAREHFAKLPQF